MNKVLETHNLPRLNHKEIRNLNTPITPKIIESVIITLPSLGKKEKAQDQMASQIYLTKYLKN